ncbi:MAG: hypothetical protein F6K26_54675, partial [Moorea sp. SIO2I5]|nr:hypothetical protein [Moorena sp. SIO2I5]
MSMSFQTEPDVIRCNWPKAKLHEQTGAFARGEKPPRNLAMQRGLGGFPHERLHQDKVLWQQPILHHFSNHFPWNLSR